MKFTILTACYNCEPWIGKCIKSVINQTHTNWEMLILDDHSTDNSLGVINKMAEGRIRVISASKRLHCGGAYARLTEEATGEVCGVLDADDVLLPDAMSKVLKCYAATSADFVWTQFFLCDPNLNVLRKGFSKLPKKGRSLLESRHAFSHWRTFKTNMREKTLIFNPEYKSAVDKWMGYSLEEVGQGVFYSKALYKYRQRLGGLSFKGRKNWEKMKVEFASKRKANNIVPIPVKGWK